MYELGIPCVQRILHIIEGMQIERLTHSLSHSLMLLLGDHAAWIETTEKRHSYPPGGSRARVQRLPILQQARRHSL